MNKYLRVIRNTWEEILTYRLNFVLWRFRTVLQLLTIYFLWSSVMPSSSLVFGYTKSMMLTYILGTSLINSIVFSTRSHEIGENINSGNLSIFLIRPINYFIYWFSRDIGDKIMNILFSLLELVILFLVLKPPVFVQTNITYLSLTVIAVILAILIHFFFGFLLGTIGFWSPEVWAPRFIFYILISFFAGGFFPLDILPKSLFLVFQILPFSYLLFFPLKIYLGQLSNIEIFTGIIISSVWVFLLYNFLKLVWTKGLKIYTAYGR